MAVLTHIATLEKLLLQWRPYMGKSYSSYRNHVYRVVNLCEAYVEKHNIILNSDEREMIAIAAAYHDAAIWLDNTFDYIEPSQQRAIAYLKQEGKDSWIDNVTNMITEHHKITSYSKDNTSLVEIFRRADWIDVSMGFLCFRVPLKKIHEIRKVFPYQGFHRKLIQLSLINTLKHPLRPLPMFKW